MSHIIVNGEMVSSNSLCINAYDRGLTLGHGLFETMLSNKGSVPLIDYHWKRLITSIEYLGIKVPFTFEELHLLINRIIQSNQLSGVRAALRLTITDGISERGLLSNGNQSPTYILTASPLPISVTESMSATVVETRRNENSLSSRIKSISYLDNILAKKEAINKGYDEAFLLNSENNLAEGSISNVFVVQNEILFTPYISDGALPGVIRHLLLNNLLLRDIEIQERKINLDILYGAEEIFITNALLGIKPIHKLDDVEFSKPYKFSKILATSLNKHFCYE